MGIGKEKSRLIIQPTKCTFSHLGLLTICLFCSADTTASQIPGKSLLLTLDIKKNISGAQLLHPQDGPSQAMAQKNTGICPYDNK